MKVIPSLSLYLMQVCCFHNCNLVLYTSMYFIVQVVTVHGIIVSTRTVTSTLTSPTSLAPMSSSKKYYCNN